MIPKMNPTERMDLLRSITILQSINHFHVHAPLSQNGRKDSLHKGRLSFLPDVQVIPVRQKLLFVFLPCREE